MNQADKLIGVVLAGGQSSRMGTDKALLRYRKEPQVVYLHDLLSAHCSKVIVSGWPRPVLSNRLDFLPDAPSYSDSGPIGGVLTAAAAAGAEAALLVVGCDYPFVASETLEQLIVNRNTTTALATVFLHPDGTPEPLLAIYEPVALKMLGEMHLRGEQSMKHFLKTHPVEKLIPRCADWLRSVDTDSDFREVTRLM